MAKRWLKLQVGVHGDPQRAHRERQEADAIEARIEERIQEDVGRAVVGSLLPATWKRKLGEWEQATADRRAEEERRRRAEHEALPRASLRLSLHGEVRGAIDARVPARVEWPRPYVEEDGQTGALRIGLEPLDSVAIGGRTFLGLHFAVPDYRGPGTYTLPGAGKDDLDAWDPLWFQFWLDSTDESFFWSAAYGPATIVVEADERSLRVEMPMEDASGERAEVSAAVTLRVENVTRTAGQDGA
jgi:hypothetical protein